MAIFPRVLNSRFFEIKFWAFRYKKNMPTIQNALLAFNPVLLSLAFLIILETRSSHPSHIGSPTPRLWFPSQTEHKQASSFLVILPLPPQSPFLEDVPVKII